MDANPILEAAVERAGYNLDVVRAYPGLKEYPDQVKLTFSHNNSKTGKMIKEKVVITFLKNRREDEVFSFPRESLYHLESSFVTYPSEGRNFIYTPSDSAKPFEEVVGWDDAVKYLSGFLRYIGEQGVISYTSTGLLKEFVELNALLNPTYHYTFPSFGSPEDPTLYEFDID